MARRRVPLRVWSLVALVVVLLPALAHASRRAVIPPGREAEVRAFVEAAVSTAREAGDLPPEFPEDPGETLALRIDEDHVRVALRGPKGEAILRLLVHHPDATPAQGRTFTAPGVALECGPSDAPRPCDRDEAAAWGPLAGRLAEARAPVVDRIWVLIEDEPVAAAQAEPTQAHAQAPRREGVGLDRGAALAAIVLGLGLAVFAVRGSRGRAHAIRWPELAILALLLLGFVSASLTLTPVLPLHEHNSFLARSDCAIDPTCIDDPAGAWNMTTMHVYGLVLASLPYRARTLALVSLACSVIALVLLWALARVVVRALGRPELGAVAGLSAVAVLAAHPVAWRLAASATFWPHAIAWALGAGLAGLWASNEDSPIARVLGWIVAAIALAIACAGNFVLLTLGALAILAPLCWTPAWRPEPNLRAIGLRFAIAGVLGLGLFALVAGPDFAAGYQRAFLHGGLEGRTDRAELTRNFSLLLADFAITPGLWILALPFALAWLWPRADERWHDAARVLAPLVYAWLVPALFLGQAAGEVVGSGYPVGFINHHWELHFCALGVGLGVAWIVARLVARFGERWTFIVPTGLTLLALAMIPLASEGWRMATGSRVLERELVALERSFAELPEHDLLIVPPQTLEPETDAPTQWDPIEVFFPRAIYREAMRARGLTPAPILGLDRFAAGELPDGLELGPRTLLYVGSSLRSYQPHEIETGAVDRELERRPLRTLRDDWALEPALTFSLRPEQHEQISARLGADREPEVELGFYWLRPR